MTKKTPATQEQSVNQIARAAGFSTLETRNSDSLDFHSVAVWELKKMLELAYQAGRDSK